MTSAGKSVRSGDARIHVLPAAGVELAQERDDDGSVHLAFDVPATVRATESVAYVAAEPVEALGDGTATADGGGLTPAGGRLRASSDGLLVLVASDAGEDVTVWFAGTAIATTSWGTNEGGRSLAVTPTAWARAGGLAASTLTWSQLVAREPDADSPSMRDQLACHELGAATKATWNLEPWRPQVDGLAMIAARCNPT